MLGYETFFSTCPGVKICCSEYGSYIFFIIESRYSMEAWLFCVRTTVLVDKKESGEDTFKANIYDRQ